MIKGSWDLKFSRALFVLYREKGGIGVANRRSTYTIGIEADTK